MTSAALFVGTLSVNIERSNMITCIHAFTFATLGGCCWKSSLKDLASCLIVIVAYFNHSATKNNRHVWVLYFLDSTAHKSRRHQISERFCLTSSLISDCDCNSTSSVVIYLATL